ncbi:MAG TPA: S53 family peptidase [Anaeromyxobacteraceae bacterium]|jgi:subtilase family serine protease|nr:S53 family peptidase [Anaeromyxobacteraceae bacterium]
MNTRFATLAVTLMACGGAVEPSSPAAPGSASSAVSLPPQASPVAVAAIPVCPGEPGLGDARCHAQVVTEQRGLPLATSSYVNGYAPQDLQQAYLLASSTAGAGQVIAVVDAYDNPTAEADLGVYRSRFGLGACTTANGCFQKIDQNGGTSYPSPDQGWALESALDLQMASAVCPLCKLLLVEAKSSSLADLGAAVNRAAAAGASVVSNSYGAKEFTFETLYESYYNHPGVAVTVSSGDSGYGVQFPAASRYVTAVGGTSLAVASSARGFNETAWSGAGSGCSAYVAKPSWQKDGGCSRRTVADVSAVADPNTGVAVYDSYGYGGQSGWFVVGGTSVSAPIVAAVYALAGNAGAVTAGSYPYARAAGLFDVIGGSNGSCRKSSSYLCTAVAGYDGPTGLGTPNGSGAF